MVSWVALRLVLYLWFWEKVCIISVISVGVRSRRVIVVYEIVVFFIKNKGRLIKSKICLNREKNWVYWLNRLIIDFNCRLLFWMWLILWVRMLERLLRFILASRLCVMVIVGLFLLFVVKVFRLLLGI